MNRFAPARFLKLRRSFAVLSLLLALAFPLSGWSQAACSQAHPQPNVLGDFQKNLDKPVVTQCGNTCYFEGSIAAMEDSLSNFLGRPLTISRPHFFSEILLYRLQTLAKEGSLPNARLRMLNGQLDVMTGGGPEFMTGIAKKRNFYILGAKTRKYVEKENQILQDLQKMSERILMSSFRNQDLAWYLYEFERRLLTEPSLTMEITPKIKAAIEEALPRITAEIEMILARADLDVGPPVKKLEFELTRTFVAFEEGPHGKRYLKADFEKHILDRVSQGKELMLSYFHIKPYTERIAGRPGFVQLPKSGPPYLSIKDIFAYNAKIRDPVMVLGGYHNAPVVDVIRSPTGRIEYLVIRNSWGQKDTSDHGYYYISVDYLAEVGHLYLADISIQ